MSARFRYVGPSGVYLGQYGPVTNGQILTVPDDEAAVIRTTNPGNLVEVADVRLSGSLPLNLLTVTGVVADAETVTINGIVYEADTGAGVTAGRQAVNTSGGGTKGVITLSMTAKPLTTETVVIGATTYTFKTALTPAANEVLIGASAATATANLIAAINGAAGAGTTYGAGTVANASAVAVLGTNVAATVTLTSDNTAPAGDETVVIGAKTYTFKTVLTPAEGEVFIGTGGGALSADAVLLNLIRAINHTGTVGTDYQCAAVHPTVSAAASVTSHAFLITAKTAGADGNLLASTETSGHLSFGATTLTGGIDKVLVTAILTGIISIASTETLSTGSFNSATLQGGAEPTLGQFVTALVTAINAYYDANTTDVELIAADLTGGVMLIYAKKPTTASIAATETLTNGSWASATFYGGAATANGQQCISRRTITAGEGSAAKIIFVFNFLPVSFLIQVLTTAGLLVTDTFSAVVAGQLLTITGTAIAATNIITVSAVGTDAIS